MEQLNIKDAINVLVAKIKKETTKDCIVANRNATLVGIVEGCVFDDDAWYFAVTRESNSKEVRRIKRERAIVRSVIDAALSLGYYVCLSADIEQGAVLTSRDDIMREIMALDEERLDFINPKGAIDPNGSGRCVGWVLFEYGRSCHDVLSSHDGGAVTKTILQSTNAMGKRLTREGVLLADLV